MGNERVPLRVELLGQQGAESSSELLERGTGPERGQTVLQEFERDLVEAPLFVTWPTIPTQVRAGDVG